MIVNHLRNTFTALEGAMRGLTPPPYGLTTKKFPITNASIPEQ